MITGGYDRTLRVWDLERPARPSIAVDAAAGTTALIVDPTGQRVVSLGARDSIELWDIARGREPLKTADAGSRIDEILTNHRDRLAVHVHVGAGSTKLTTSALDPVSTVPGWPVAFSPTGADVANRRAGAADDTARRPSSWSSVVAVADRGRSCGRTPLNRLWR